MICRINFQASLIFATLPFQGERHISAKLAFIFSTGLPGDLFVVHGACLSHDYVSMATKVSVIICAMTFIHLREGERKVGRRGNAGSGRSDGLR